MDLPKPAARAALRRSRVAGIPAAEDAARLRHFLGWLPSTPGVLATYVSVDGEPDTVGLIDEVVALGWEVRVPIIRREVDWGRFEGWERMRPGWRSIPTPTGPRLGAGSLRDADVVLASCLAVDHRGYRLGVGGGWYDRALVHRGPGSTILAWARESEVLEEVPIEPHDVPVDGWVTEAGVFLA